MSTYQFRIAIEGAEPPVWRKVEVPDRITFHQLHLVLQRCFQWKDYHLYKFELPGVGDVMRLHEGVVTEDDTAFDAREQLIDPYMEPGLRFRYVYDFGDNWEHVVDLEGVDPLGEARAPVVTAFSGESMIEDCGGPGGYDRVMRALADPSDPEHRELKEWARFMMPDRFSAESANAEMDEMLYFPRAAYEAARPERSGAGEGGPRVSLKDVVDSFDYQSETMAAYIDLDAGEVRMLELDDSVDHEFYERSVSEYEACESLMLPRPDQLGDYGVMRDYAASQEPAVAERLARALDGRGAFRRFKDEVARMGLSEDWYAFRDDARANLARDFLEEHGVRWR